MAGRKNNAATASGAQSRTDLVGHVLANLRWILPLAIFVGACAAGWLVLWQQVRDRVVSNESYQLDPAKIEITSLPTWIHSDLKTQVISDASLGGSLSILDDELTVRIARAFQLHPWVAKVERVSKTYPAGVTVDLIYRQPVAMVEVNTNEVLPVDADGVVLPSEDFSREDASFNYLLISEIKTQPLGPVGTHWQDTRVAGGAKVAAALGKYWKKLKLRHIVPANRMVGTRETDAYEIYTQQRTQIDWGRPPGAEVPGEPPAATKLAWLIDYVEKHDGSLDNAETPHRIDVRGASGLTTAPVAPIQNLSSRREAPQ